MLVTLMPCKKEASGYISHNRDLGTHRPKSICHGRWNRATGICHGRWNRKLGAGNGGNHLSPVSTQTYTVIHACMREKNLSAYVWHVFDAGSNHNWHWLVGWQEVASGLTLAYRACTPGVDESMRGAGRGRTGRGAGIFDTEAPGVKPQVF